MLQRILTEKISLREGNQIRRVSKAEALVRSMILGAMKGDSKAISTLFKITFENAQPEDEAPIQVIIRRFSPDANQRGRQADQK